MREQQELLILDTERIGVIDARILEYFAENGELPS